MDARIESYAPATHGNNGAYRLDSSQIDSIVRRFCWLPLSFIIALMGCQSGPDMSLVERELRLQEDHIYELEDQLEDSQAVSQTYRRENVALRQRLGTTSDGSADAQSDKPKRSRRSILKHENAPKPPNGSPDVDFTPPVIEGEENGIELPPGISPGPDANADPQALNLNSVHQTVGNAQSLPIGSVEHITLHKLLGSASNSQQNGLLVRAVVELRSPEGEPVRSAGEISLMILDPETFEEQEHIARWDFPLDTTSTRWRRTGLGSGLHFELPLPVNLEGRTYELWARVVTPDGQKHLANIEFEVNREALMAAKQLEQNRLAAIDAATQERIDKATAAEAQPVSPINTQQIATDPNTEAPKWTPSPIAAELEEATVRKASRRPPEWSPFR